jgi:predicted site-specific integrase-resolvase
MGKIREITREELRRIYENNTIAEACEELGISTPTLRKYLKKANIPSNKPVHKLILKD